MLMRVPFYFIRHGETDHNAKEICAGGKTNTPLNAKGIEQANSLKTLLQDKNFWAIFSSPLERAVDTAFLATGQVPQISVDLREWEVGEFEETLVAPFLLHIQTLPFQTLLPKGESKEMFFNRSIAALNEILQTFDHPLIVAHGGTYWAILYALQLQYQHIDNATCLYFTWEKNALNIKTLK